MEKHETPVRRIGVIGGGFSGSLLTAHLMRLSRQPTEIVLIEKSGRFGRGLAYATEDAGHLLNVRVNNMSAFPDDPGHFLRWLRSRAAASEAPAADAFVSRRTYGAYLEEVFAQSCRDAGPLTRLETLAGEVVRVVPEPAGFALHLAGGRVVTVDQAVLSIGNFPPSPPAVPEPAIFDTPHYLGNPWDLGELSRVAPDQPVLIIGTGLTMVDVVITLVSRGHRAPITALSRRGLRPNRHRDVEPYGDFIAGTALPTTLLDLLGRVRREVRSAAARGIDWRSVVDALRPHIRHLWRALPIDEQRRFLRHLRAYWDVHRHRMAPEIADLIDRQRQEGRLRFVTGRLADLALVDGQVRATVFPRGGGAPILLTADRVINSTGPECDFRRLRAPLVRALLAEGTVRVDRLGLGLEVTERDEIVNARGGTVSGLFAFGPLTRGAYWEMLAVPELRTQALSLARTLTALQPTRKTNG
jgi:uncharacterized NAD(P)/FAD-binding protein YdhS